MPKICFAICLLLISVFRSNGQNPNDYFNIQNYKNNVALTLHSRSHSQFVVSQYGLVKNQLGSNYNYFFQGQELDEDLGLYFFPSRIYSPREKRFYQPDPKSQYPSSYLFVRADPVNIVDRSGNEGKPLVLSGIENQKPTLSLTKDLAGYDYSLVDFLDNKIPDLPEWNGNVYISAHMGQDGTMAIENTDLPGEIQSLNLQKTKGINTHFKEPNAESKLPRRVTVELDGKAFGNKLKEFSMDQNIRLKNVVFGGCHGGEAAKKASSAFESAAPRSKLASAETNFFGTKKGHLVAVGRHEGNLGWTWMPSDASISPTADMHVNYNGRPQRVYSYIPADENFRYPAYGTPSEPVVNDMLEHGRMSSYTRSFVDHIPTSY